MYIERTFCISSSRVPPGFSSMARVWNEEPSGMYMLYRRVLRALRRFPVRRLLRLRYLAPLP